MRDKTIPAGPGAPLATSAESAAQLRSREWAPRRRRAESGGREPLAADRDGLASPYLSLLHIYMAICRRSRPQTSIYELPKLLPWFSGSSGLTPNRQRGHRCRLFPKCRPASGFPVPSRLRPDPRSDGRFRSVILTVARKRLSMSGLSC